MADSANPYQALDHPEILAALFHPRREPSGWRPPVGTRDHLIPVADGSAVGGPAKVGARFHIAGPEEPNLLFFHGNGEIVADYDDIGQAYAHAGINLLAVDYRGYGRSDGSPTATTMLADSRAIFIWIRRWLQTESHRGPLAVMGRSLGSAAALELAAAWPTAIAALIIESGFAHTAPLLRTLGAALAPHDLRPGSGFRQLVKMGTYAGPVLVIHAEQDHLIPWPEGEALLNASPSPSKEMLTIAGANHNDIFMRAWPAYLAAVSGLLRNCRSQASPSTSDRLADL
jgi:fermentation-respiration switch protein FrsA (DUF1100 family)